MLRRALFTIAVVGLIAVMATSAGAQGQGRQGRGGQGRTSGFGGFGGRGGGGVPSLSSLVQVEEVQKEIEMSEDQVKEYGSARQEVSDDIRGLERPDREASQEDREKFMAKVTKIQTRLDTEIQDVLLPHQTDRLWELYVQQNKSNALDHPVIAKKLKITADQKKKLAKINEEMTEARTEMFRSLFGNRGGGGGNTGGRTRGGRPGAEGEEGARPRADNNGAAIENGQGQVFVQQQERPQRGQGAQRGQGRGGFNSEAFTEMREKMTKMGEDTEKKRLAVLTATQRKEFTAMAGKKFEFPERQRGNFGGGRTGGGEGGRTRGGRPGAEGGRGEGRTRESGGRPPIQ
jgi:hypothetical protein